MESRTKPLLVYSFGALLVLTAIAGAAALWIFERVRTGESAIQVRHRERSERLHRIRASILLSGTLARDYFFDPNGPEAASLLDDLALLQRETNTELDSYASEAVELRGETAAYWKVLDLMAEIARKRRTPGVDAYFQRQLAQRRQAMLRIAGGIESTLEQERRDGQARAERMYGRLRLALIAVPLLLASLGGILAALTVRRLVRLEAETRALSAQLVRAQEEERRSISRELHDEIGQWLSALRLEAGQILKEGGASQRLHAIAELAERCVEAVRRIALSLRPSMLDDLGLVPALEWQARETGARAGIAVRVLAEDSAGDLPDSHRTCIFRVAQEALHNCARHARAQCVEVSLERSANRVSLSVADDGRGFAPARSRGLGLLGMEERVGQLGGRLRVRSEPGAGTTVIAELPL